MCDICDGNTYEDRYQRIDELIRERFWLLMSVEGDDEHLPWAYTIGLTEVTGHPELVVAGACAESAASALNEIGLRIRAGERFEVPTRHPVYRPAKVPVHLRPVHPDHWSTSRFAGWLDYYEHHRRWFPSAPAAVQVVLADRAGRFPWDAGHHPVSGHAQLLLDAAPADAEG